MKENIFCLGKNLKIEIGTMVMYILIYFLRKYIHLPCFDDFKLALYLSQDRLNGIATFFAITIGVYIAVLTVLATSEIGISEEMLKRNLDKPLINVMIAGMVENFISVGLAIFIPVNGFTEHVLIVSVLISLISFVKFILLLVIICKGNMNYMAKAIDSEREYRDRLSTCAEEICRYIREHK